MAYVSMMCSCGAEFSCDFDEAETEGTEYFYFAHRFAAAHAPCGYMVTPHALPEEPPAPGVETPMTFDEKGEEDENASTD